LKTKERLAKHSRELEFYQGVKMPGERTGGGYSQMLERYLARET